MTYSRSLIQGLSSRRAPNLVRDTTDLEPRHRQMKMGIHLCWGQGRKPGMYFIKEGLCLDLKDDWVYCSEKAGRTFPAESMYVPGKGGKKSTVTGGRVRKGRWEMRLECTGCSQIMKGPVGPARVCLCHVLEWTQPDAQIWYFQKITGCIWCPEAREEAWRQEAILASAAMVLMSSWWPAHEWKEYNRDGSRN